MAKEWKIAWHIHHNINNINNYDVWESNRKRLSGPCSLWQGQVGALMMMMMMMMMILQFMLVLTDKSSEINDDTCWNQYIFLPKDKTFQNISTLLEYIVFLFSWWCLIKGESWISLTARRKVRDSTRSLLLRWIFSWKQSLLGIFFNEKNTMGRNEPAINQRQQHRWTSQKLLLLWLWAIKNRFKDTLISTLYWKFNKAKAKKKQNL